MGCYLVTGAAGFIASRVTELLLANGHSVVGVDNLNDAYDVRLKLWRLAQFEGKPGFRFHKLDITDLSALAGMFAARRAAGEPRFDAVINLAARAGVRYSVENPWIYFETNGTGTLNLLELSREYEIGKFVLASSSSLYGKANPLPYREDQNSDQPLSPYAASKKAAEALCYTSNRRDGLSLFHGVRAGRASRYDALPVGPMDQRGPSGHGVRRRPAVARFHLRG